MWWVGRCKWPLEKHVASGLNRPDGVEEWGEGGEMRNSAEAVSACFTSRRLHFRRKRLFPSLVESCPRGLRLERISAKAPPAASQTERALREPQRLGGGSSEQPVPSEGPRGMPIQKASKP